MELLKVNNLSVSFAMRGSRIRAVRGVSFTVAGGEIAGIVGESGSGKTVMCLSLLRLIPQPPGHIEGEAFLGDTNLLGCSEKRIREIRGNRISMIFQDPSTSLNPYMRISDQIIESVRTHRNITRKEALDAAVKALDEVGIPRARERIHCHPHEFSGGMRQRVMIAMALITRPSILFADEPTTALDVTVQAQILGLLRRLQKNYGMSILFITHNLGVVAQLCNRVFVMYAGQILESAPVDRLFAQTGHPYTRSLIRSIPSVHKAGEDLYMIPGVPPDPSVPVEGCPFAPRCEYSSAECIDLPAELGEVGPGHHSACTRLKKGTLQWIQLQK